MKMTRRMNEKDIDRPTDSSNLDVAALHPPRDVPLLLRGYAGLQRRPPQPRDLFQSCNAVSKHGHVAMSTSSSVPPTAFAMVAPHIYRSGFPTRHNIEYLSRLNLRCIVKLHVGAAHSEEVQSWVNAAGIEVVECCVAANKEPFVVADAEEIHKALRLILDPQRQPVLIHSLRGQARMGVVIACLRKLQQWSYTTIIEEYRRFTGSGASLLDMQYIELFPITPAERAMLRAVTPPPEPNEASANGDEERIYLSLASPTMPTSTQPTSSGPSGQPST